jgi:very-short-patch-repair endonuclease
MKPAERREVMARFRAQHSLVARPQLRLLGVTAKVEQHRLATGEWYLFDDLPVIALSGARRTPEQALLAACLAAGATAIASHQSAAWLWGLNGPPGRHAITVPRGAFRHRAPFDVHRPTDYPAHVVVRQGIPTTDPLRALVDLAGVVDADALDDAVDVALAKRLLTVEGIRAEVDRLGRPGRNGAGVMRAALLRRGFDGAPNPSVLESKLLRLFHQAGITPIGVEVQAGPDGRYRLDTLLAPNVSAEVDGYTYHSSPEQVAEDNRRRQRLRSQGLEILEYTWRDVTLDQRRLIEEVRKSLERR